MNRILSQQEIDALLGSAATLEGARRPRTPSDAATAYNFRRPDRVSKEQIRSLQFLHDRFARNVATSLSAYLRTVTEVGIVSVEHFTYSEFLMSLPDPTAFYSLTMAPLDGLGALELNPAVAFTMIERMLGGRGQRTTVNRALTEIEQNVIDGVVKVILENLSETWQQIAPVQFRVNGRETRPQMLQVAAPNESMLLLVFETRVADARGMLNLCIPTAGLESLATSFTQGWYRNRRKRSDAERDALFNNLGRVRMPVIATIDTSLRARDLLRLQPGDVLSLGVPLDEPVVVRIGGSDQFAGHLVKAGAHAAVVVDGVPAKSGQVSGAQS